MDTNRADHAVGCMRDGLNCAQAVFSSFSDESGIDREQALKLATGFGAGVACRGEVCGAVSGAVLVIGLKHGRASVEDVQAKEKTYALVNEFVRRFNETHETIICRELIGHDLSTPEGLQKARESGVFVSHCVRYVKDTVTLLEDLLK